MENILTIDPDKVLTRLGKFGRYQLWIYFVTNLIYMEQSFQFMQMAFTDGTPPHDCIPDFTGDMVENNSRSMLRYGQVQYGSRTCTATVKNVSIPCGTNGTHFLFEKDYGTTIVSEWYLLCGKVFYAHLPASLFMAGGIFGALFLTQLSDKFGRKWTFIVCCWAVAVLGTLSGIAPNYTSYVIIRILTGVSASGMAMVAWVISCEVISVEVRTYSTIFGGLCWTFAYVILGILAHFIRDWRNLSIAVAAPFFLTISFCWVLPESLHWLVAKGKTKQAKKWIAHAAKFNGITISLDDESLYLDPKSAAQKNLESRTVLDIFKSPILAAHTLILCYMWLNNTLVYYGLSFFSTELSGNRFLNFILSGLVELPAVLGIPFLNQRIGRRWCNIMSYIIAGVSLLCLAVVGDYASPIVQNTLSLIGKFAVMASFICLHLLMAEIFPTKVRTAGCGFACMVGRLGSVLAPYTGTMNTISPKLAPGVFGSMSLIGAILCYALPETRGVNLPEDIHEVLPGPVFKFCCKTTSHQNLAQDHAAHKETLLDHGNNLVI